MKTLKEGLIYQEFKTTNRKTPNAEQQTLPMQDYEPSWGGKEPRE